MVFEAVPDLGITDYSVRICRARITRIGDGLPCVRYADTRSKEVYSKSRTDLEFNDMAEVDIGRLCPVNFPGADGKTNEFTANVVYELPPQLKPDGTNALPGM